MNLYERQFFIQWLLIKYYEMYVPKKTFFQPMLFENDIAFCWHSLLSDTLYIGDIEKVEFKC